MDVATFGRTRPSTSKVRVEIDLTKPQVTRVYVGQEEETNPLKGFTQNIDYEHVPKYCMHCKLIGHSLVQCRAAIKKKSIEETEDKIEVEQTQASKQSDEEMEKTSNMISERKILEEEQEEQNQGSKSDTNQKQSQVLEINSERIKKDINTNTPVHQISKGGDQETRQSNNLKEDDATNEQSVKAFSPPPDLNLHDVVIQQVQEVIEKEVLSPRGPKISNRSTKKSTTAPNTRGLGPLGAYVNGNKKPENMRIRDCIKDEAWDVNTISSNITKRTAGIGGVVRNRNGDLIMAFAKALHFCTNNQTEVQAALYALNWCKQNNMTNCILEMDSLMTINMMKGVYKPSWELTDDIKYMTQIAHNLNIKVQHCYREGNESADALAKFGANSEMSTEARIFSQVCELPTEARGVYRMDRSQILMF
ncbi:hypothetical protein A4A49_09538 [Nicotiana attenuata]|uniref:RNase H type-1 domain-containing protein n=1 Tax=Nicotiana attenuata TaxID=49451 RepID=A0A1J6I6L4_NICAT|nr:hypothetical protein A4A49_09538 [Nicotiana attenuata]